MTLFDVFMLIIGMFSVLTIILWIVGRVDPSVREEEITEWLYDFLFGIDIDANDLYERD